MGYSERRMGYYSALSAWVQSLGLKKIYTARSLCGLRNSSIRSSAAERKSIQLGHSAASEFLQFAAPFPAARAQVPAPPRPPHQQELGSSSTASPPLGGARSCAAATSSARRRGRAAPDDGCGR